MKRHVPDTGLSFPGPGVVGLQQRTEPVLFVFVLFFFAFSYALVLA